MTMPTETYAIPARPDLPGDVDMLLQRFTTAAGDCVHVTFERYGATWTEVLDMKCEGADD